MKNQNEIDIYKYPIKILYQDYDVKNHNFKDMKFDLSKVEYYDDLMFGEKFLARNFNEYLGFDVLDFKMIHSPTNYPMFVINIRKIKLKKFFMSIK